MLINNYLDVVQNDLTMQQWICKFWIQLLVSRCPAPWLDSQSKRWTKAWNSYSKNVDISNNWFLSFPKSELFSISWFCSCILWLVKSFWHSHSTSYQFSKASFLLSLFYSWSWSPWTFSNLLIIHARHLTRSVVLVSMFSSRIFTFNQLFSFKIWITCFDPLLIFLNISSCQFFLEILFSYSFVQILS